MYQFEDFFIKMQELIRLLLLKKWLFRLFSELCAFSFSELNEMLPQKRRVYKYHASEEAISSFLRKRTHNSSDFAKLSEEPKK
jgi:hypothetical protein